MTSTKMAAVLLFVTMEMPNATGKNEHEDHGDDGGDALRNDGDVDVDDR